MTPDQFSQLIEAINGVTYAGHWIFWAIIAHMIFGD